MLLTFSVKNFKSFKDKATLDLRAASIDEYDEINTFEVPGEGKVLKGAFIFGGNSAGKSNLLKALYYMKKVVCHSFNNQHIIEEGNNFLLDLSSKSLPSVFECEFKSDKYYYKYAFSILKGKIVNEKLERKNLRYVVLFERNEKNELIGKADFVAKIRKFIKNVRDNALVVSVLTALNDEECGDVYNWFNDITFVNPRHVGDLNDDQKYIECLKFADKTIKGVYSKKIEISEEEKTEMHKLFGEKFPAFFEKMNKENYTKHIVYDDNKKPISEIDLPIKKFASQGTIKYMSLLIPIFKALEKGSVICIDEIDSNLHVSLVNYLVKLFNSIDRNPKNAQILTTTHDVFLLDENIRRDQIVLVDKNIYGESRVYSLVDLKGVKKRDTILKKYLLGYYGAVPCIKDIEDE